MRAHSPREDVIAAAATLDTPADLLYSTAIRSVDHAVECHCSPLATPATEALSLQGLRLLAHALPAVMQWNSAVNAQRQRAPAYPPVLANPRPIRAKADVRETLALAW